MSAFRVAAGLIVAAVIGSPAAEADGEPAALAHIDECLDAGGEDGLGPADRTVGYAELLAGLGLGGFKRQIFRLIASCARAAFPHAGTFTLPQPFPSTRRLRIWSCQLWEALLIARKAPSGYSVTPGKAP